MRKEIAIKKNLDLLNEFMKYAFGNPEVIEEIPPDAELTPLLHKDAIESNGCSHKKAGSNLFRILSKGHSWMDPGDDIDLTAAPLWLRV